MVVFDHSDALRIKGILLNIRRGICILTFHGMKVNENLRYLLQLVKDEGVLSLTITHSGIESQIQTVWNTIKNIRRIIKYLRSF